ncbi:MAG: flagellar basal body rod protein [Burkholderiaceae bacterium]
MSSISLSTALSGISAANERLRASAHNTANLGTENFRREQVEMSTTANNGGVQTTTTRAAQTGVDPATEMVEQRSATYAFVANLRVLQTQVRAEGTLLDIHA